MELSGGLRVLLFILLTQVFTECASAQDFVNQFFPGSQNPELEPPGEYPGYQYPGFQSPFLYSRPAGPTFSEDDLTVLVGSNLEVPYTLYKQISESFLSTTNILVLLPNNTIVQVSGYAGLKDIAKVDPDDTKVLISSDTMIPAAIYLRIVLIQPEEVMVRLPDGQILPNQIYQERYGKKLITQDEGGQSYFQRVPPKESFSFLVVNDPERGLSHGNPFPSSISEVADHVVLPAEVEVPIEEPTLSVPPTPLPSQGPIQVPEYPEPQPIHYPESIPVLCHPEPNSVLHCPEPVPVPHYTEHTLTHPYLGRVLGPSYPEPKPKFKYPGPVSTTQSSYYPEPKATPRHYHPRPSYLSQIPASHVEPRRAPCEQKARLPPGVHVMDTSRCNICDPGCEAAHVRVFIV